MRSGFYAASPVATIGKYSHASPGQITGAQQSLLRMNRAGQMVNDLQDFDQSGDRPRISIFSDIRNGVSSVPIRHLWRASGEKDRQRFSKVFGKADLQDADIEFINRLVAETDLPSAMLGHINAEYAGARDQYVSILAPSIATRNWLDRWLAYKQEQARSVAHTLGVQMLTNELGLVS